MADNVYLGGSEDSLVVGRSYDLVARQTALQVWLSPATRNGSPVVAYPVARGSITLAISGPGETSTGGGFVGGGFGAKGAVEGMAAAAAVLNHLTAKSSTTTHITVTSADSEAYFVHDVMAPDVLRRHLSTLFVALAAERPSLDPRPAPRPGICDRCCRPAGPGRGDADRGIPHRRGVRAGKGGNLGEVRIERVGTAHCTAARVEHAWVP